LYTDLLAGIFGGLLLAMITHLLLAKALIRQYFQMIYKSGSNIFVKQDGTYCLKIKGIANFLGAIKMNKLLAQIPGDSNVKIDLSGARLVDYSILEKLYDFKRNQFVTGGQVEITRLKKHISSTNHKLGLKILTTSAHELTRLEKGIMEVADKYKWQYDNCPIEHFDYIESLYFFKSRPIESKTNCLWSKDDFVKYEISDITFEEGAYMSYREYRTTLGLLTLPFDLPKFTVERKSFLTNTWI
jgi:MFS superfamily sulfate permease-like transporter